MWKQDNRITIIISIISTDKRGVLDLRVDNLEFLIPNLTK